MANSTHPPRIRGLSDIVSGYRYILCDAWGVLHNGLTAYPAAGEALVRARAAGIAAFVLTNAPRPKAEVATQFARFGVDPAAHDDIVTSGEAARDYLAARPAARAHYVGPDRDRVLLDGIDLALTGEVEADLIVCTGLFDDDRETPDDYLARMEEWVARGLPFVCANPDKVVERGDRILWCAGALAERYAALGGEVVLFGKPHAPIYATALRRLASFAGRPVHPSEVLAIGDAAETDLRGANEAGLDVLFVTAGIHAERFGPRENPDGAEIGVFLKNMDLVRAPTCRTWRGDGPAREDRPWSRFPTGSPGTSTPPARRWRIHRSPARQP
jgi:HAD superfamily hydrolase (TIGR01459 family)